jgi:hypothetical protein
MWLRQLEVLVFIARKALDENGSLPYVLLFESLADANLNPGVELERNLALCSCPS